MGASMSRYDKIKSLRDELRGLRILYATAVAEIKMEVFDRRLLGNDRRTMADVINLQINDTMGLIQALENTGGPSEPA